MNETIALRPDSRASAKDSVVDYTLASLEELEQLHPALNLLAHPSIAQDSHDFFVRCYDAGVRHAQAGAFAMAVLLNGLGEAGRVALTQAMGKDAAENFMQQARSKIFLRSEDQATVSYACWLAGEFERIRLVARRHKRQLGIAVKGAAQVAQLAVHPRRQRRLG